MSTATAPAPRPEQIKEMANVISDQRAAEAAGRSLYQAFKASTVAVARKGTSWLGRMLDKFGIRRAIARGWQFVSPWVTRAGAIASRIGILPSLAFAVTTHRGRHLLLNVVPEKLYKVVVWPIKTVGRGIAWVMTKLGYGQYANMVSARFTLAECWVLERYQTALDFLQDNHSSWGMRIARNGLFALLGLRVVAMIPSLPLKALALIALVLCPTSEIVGNPGEVYPDSIGYLGFDTVMTVLGRTGSTENAAKVPATAQRSPKASDLARKAGDQAKAAAVAAGANRSEARRIGEFTRRSYMEENAGGAQSTPLVPATA